jgi:hypothetical protein
MSSDAVRQQNPDKIEVLAIDWDMAVEAVLSKPLSGPIPC